MLPKTFGDLSRTSRSCRRGKSTVQFGKCLPCQGESACDANIENDIKTILKEKEAITEEFRYRPTKSDVRKIGFQFYYDERYCYRTSFGLSLHLLPFEAPFSK